MVSFSWLTKITNIPANTLVLVCYPPHGLGPSGVRAILSFFEDEDDGGKV